MRIWKILKTGLSIMNPAGDALFGAAIVSLPLKKPCVSGIWIW